MGGNAWAALPLTTARGPLTIRTGSADKCLLSEARALRKEAWICLAVNVCRSCQRAHIDYWQILLTICICRVYIYIYIYTHIHTHAVYMYVFIYLCTGVQFRANQHSIIFNWWQLHHDIDRWTWWRQMPLPMRINSDTATRNNDDDNMTDTTSIVITSKQPRGMSKTQPRPFSQLPL